LSDNDDGNHPHDARRPASLQTTFNVQTQMLRTIKTLLVELTNKVDILVAAATGHKNSPIPNQPSNILLLPKNAICHKPAPQPPHIHPPKTQIPPWPPHHADHSNKLAPVSQKFSPYKKHIPAKPPFKRGRHNLAMTRTKDCMRPP